MFSYTDDAIVTSSPTGRHLSTVIRRPAGMPNDQWRKHADQVCQLLNELDRASKCKEMRLALSYAEGPAGLQAYGRSEVLAELRSSGPYMADLERRFGPTWPFEDQMPLATDKPELDQAAIEAQSAVVTATSAAARIAELEKQLDDATTKLCAAQMLLEKPIEVSNDLAQVLQKGRPGQTFLANRTFKRVE